MGSGDESVTVKKNSVIELDLSKIHNDYAGKVNFKDFDYFKAEHDGLFDVLKAIEYAKTDDKIKGISILNSSSDLGIAQTKALRDQLEDFKKEYPNRIVLIENFGKTNYFSAMYYAKLLIGNTSSGIIEAASFGKYVINVGDRQKGRAQSKNILDASFNAKNIILKTKQALSLGQFKEDNIYFKEGAVDTIIKIIKENEKL